MKWPFEDIILYLSCQPNDDSIARAVAQAFSIKVEQVLLVKQYDDWPGFDGNLHLVVCKVLEIDIKDFPLEVTLAVQADIVSEENDLGLIGRISEALCCKLLANPASPIKKDSILFNGVGDFQEVYVRQVGDELVIFS